VPSADNTEPHAQRPREAEDSPLLRAARRVAGTASAWRLLAPGYPPASGRQMRRPRPPAPQWMRRHTRGACTRVRGPPLAHVCACACVPSQQSCTVEGQVRCSGGGRVEPPLHTCALDTANSQQSCAQRVVEGAEKQVAARGPMGRGLGALSARRVCAQLSCACLAQARPTGQFSQC